MARKGKNTKYYFLGIVVVVALAVLLVDFDKIGDFTPLSSDDITYTIPVPNSLIPLEPDDFDPILNTNFVLPAVECKVKQTTKIYDVNGKLSRTEESRGIQGSPQLQTGSLVTPANVGTSHYTVEPKIFCQIQQGFPNLLVTPSDLTVQVYGQTNPASEQRVLLQSQNLRTYQVIFTDREFVDPEKIIGITRINANDIEPLFQNQNFNSQLEFRVFGTINMKFDTTQLTTTYEIPVLENQIRSYYVQPVRVDQEPDRDLDGIIDVSDNCPDQKETFNNYQDTDGCPDTKPSTTQTGTTTTGTPEPIVDKASCNADGKTWYLKDGDNTCGFPYAIGNGQVCKEYNINTQTCIDPKISESTTTPTNLDDDNDGVQNSNDFCPDQKEDGKQAITINAGTGILEAGARDGCPVTVSTVCNGIIVGITTRCDTSGGLTDAEINADLLKGRIISIATYNYNDSTTESIISDSLNTGNFDSGSFAIQSLVIIPSVTSETQKQITSITIEAFYVRETIEEAKSIKLITSGVNVIPSIKISGSNALLGNFTLTNGDINQIGKTFSGKYNGVSLGKKVIEQSVVFSKAEPFLPTTGQKDLIMTISMTGFFDIEKSGVKKRLSIIESPFITLDSITVSKGVEPKTIVDCEKVGKISSYDEFGNKSCIDEGSGSLVCVDISGQFKWSCSNDYVQTNCGVKSPPAQCIEPDTDGDLVIDRLDKCPNEKEDGKTTTVSTPTDGCKSEISTCPANNICKPVNEDSDGDGVLDKNDRCPNQAGSGTDGCPVTTSTDSDGDGFPNTVDQCPTIAGSYNGCPEKPIYNPPPPICSLNAQGERICTPQGGIFDDPMILIIGAIMIFVIAIIVLIAKRR